MGMLDKLVERNDSPVLFIGSGMSLRYLANYPNWNSLLLFLWKKCNKDESTFYENLLQLRSEIMEHESDNSVIDFQTNIKMASRIQGMYNNEFNKGRVKIDGFSPKDAYDTKTDPFKKEVSIFFSKYSFLEDMADERTAFTKLLLKSRAIITTNYDLMLEGLVKDEFSIFTDQTDLFLSPEDCGGLFKVHGCVSCPNQIILTEDDYKRFDENSIIIGSKLVSFLLESPIIFLGYSLTDQNISTIFKKFTNSLRPEQRPLLAERIIYINRKEGELGLSEYKLDSTGLGAQLTVIETDNYKAVYDKLNQISSGVSVGQVRKFKERIRKLIIDRGRKGTLKSLLICPTGLDTPNENDDITVIAIGDQTCIFSLPDRLDYIKDYIKPQPEIPLTVALRFIASQTSKTRIPIYKHINCANIEQSDLRADQIEKIKQRLENHNKAKIMNSIPKHARISMRDQTISSIIAKEPIRTKQLDIIAYNIDAFTQNEVFEYMRSLLESIQFGEWALIGTPFARLITLWDCIYIKKGS